MPDLLSPEWLDLQRAAMAGLPERPGASARIQYDLSGGPDGPVSFFVVLEDGRIDTSGLGPADEPDFTMAMTWADFVASVRGEFDPTEGFMQGKVKVTGNIGRMLSVLPVTTSAEWHGQLQEIAADTSGL